MKRTAALLLAMCAGLLLPWSAARAQPAADAALRAIDDLARLNGQALACRDVPAAQRAKALMLAHAPKTPRFATAYEEGTQASFIAQTRNGAACPEAGALAAQIDAVARRLQTALAGSTHAGAATAAEDLPLRSMPRYLLQGPSGRAVTSEDFRGRFQLVTFGFVSCPDVCPTTMLELREVLAALGARASKLQPIFVTVDPQRDTPAVLESYAKGFDARILALGGSEALVRRAADAFKVHYARVQEPGAAADAYTMEHTVGLYLLGPDGQLVERIAYGTPAQAVAARVAAWMGNAAAQ